MGILGDLPVVEELVHPSRFTVAVVTPQHGKAWERFVGGTRDFLDQSDGGRQRSVEAGRYTLEVLYRSWSETEEPEAVVSELLDQRNLLAVVAATTSQEARRIVPLLEERKDGPVLLLATATNSDLLKRPTPTGERPREGIFRMVPENSRQVERLMHRIDTIRREDPDAQVAIFREEKVNRAFSRDLARKLRLMLEKQSERGDDTVLIDATVDDLIAIPEELATLAPKIIVYIGSQARALTLHRQIRQMAETLELSWNPEFILTDASVSDHRYSSRNGLIRDSYATFPIANMGTKSTESRLEIETLERAGIQYLGWDALLVLRAALRDLDRRNLTPGRRTLARILKRPQRFDGVAQDYRFHETGENELADFHLWRMEEGAWIHAHQGCGSKMDRGWKVTDARTTRRPSFSGGSGETQAASKKAPAELSPRDPDGPVLIGAKPFAEQRILAAILSRALSDAGIHARRGAVSLNRIRDLLKTRRIDVYWEYTGSVLRHEPTLSEDATPSDIALHDARHHNLHWWSPLDFNNTFVLITPENAPRVRGLDSVSDLARAMRGGSDLRICAEAGWLYDFEDGLDPLRKHYGPFPYPFDLRVETPISETYQALEGAADQRRCDIGVVYRTDSRLSLGGYRQIADDQSFFPEYRPAPVFHGEALDHLREEHGEALGTVRSRLTCVSRHLTENRMSELNYAVEFEDASPREVAHGFLERACPRRVSATAASP